MMGNSAGSTDMGDSAPCSNIGRARVRKGGILSEYSCRMYRLSPCRGRFSVFHFQNFHWTLHCMGARERGRIAASAPVALRPVPVGSAQLPWFKVLLIFSSGFVSACSVIWWILFGLVYVD